jgi:hypothetical protein
VADLYLGSALAPDLGQARQAGGVSLPPERLASLAGAYRRSTGDILRIELRDGKLALQGARTELLPLSSTRFALRGVDGEATFDTTADGMTTLRFQRGTGPVQEYRQMRKFSPTAAQLASFAGRYRSSELDTDIRVAASDSGLTLIGRRPGSITMTPLYTDAFRGDMGVIEFSRGGDGRVNGFVVNAGRVRFLRFDRIE